MNRGILNIQVFWGVILCIVLSCGVRTWHCQRYDIPEDLELYQHCFENLQSRIKKLKVKFHRSTGHESPEGTRRIALHFL